MPLTTKAPKRRRSRSRGDRRNVRITHRMGCTVLTDRRFGRIIIPGTWHSITAVREALHSLPAEMKRCKFFA